MTLERQDEPNLSGVFCNTSAWQASVAKINKVAEGPWLALDVEGFEKFEALRFR
jgi:hypothetical protein